ncbi:hypothetical protein DRO27_05235, partial [Candidatus Bathyarchaeota archaeon]
MRKAVFLVATLCKDPTPQFPLRDTDLELLGAIADEAGLEAEVVFVTTEAKYAGAEKKLRAPILKAAHSRVLEEIGAINPDYVFAFGRMAMACLINKGSSVLKHYRRKANDIEGVACPVFVTDSLSRIMVQPGIRKWLRLDILAAVRGYNETQWGEHTLLTPDMPEWSVMPDEFQQVEKIGFDLETYPGVDPWAPDSRIRMAILSAARGRATVVQTHNGELPDWVLGLLADVRIVKGGSNIAFDHRWCARFGYEVNNLHDTETAEHIIDCTDPNKNLKYLALRYEPKLNDYNRDLDEKIKQLGGWEFLTDEEMYQYAGGDGEASIACMLQQQETIASRADHTQIWKLMRDVYPVQCHMNNVGLRVDPVLNQELYDGMSLKLSELILSIQQVLGPINPASATALSKALVSNIKGIDLRVKQWKRILSDDEEEEISTDRTILMREAHRHPIIGTVLEFRKWNKMFGSFVKALRDKHMVQQYNGMFVYPSYLSARAETLRFASKNPNAQQLPRKPGEEESPLLNVKRQFISRFDGGTLLQADYGQMEVRIAAQESQDGALLAAIGVGRDVHSETASKMFRVDAGDVTEEMRYRAKTINFGVIYGMGPGRLSKILDISRKDASDVIGAYFRVYPQLRHYINESYNKVMRDLSITTPFGHTRTFVRPNYGNWEGFEGARIKRQGFNTIIQSTAACVMYVALIEVHAALAG